MRIVLQTCLNTDSVDQYLTFNRIPFEKIDLWSEEQQRHTVHRMGLEQSPRILLVVDVDILRGLIRWPQSRLELIEFCRQHQLWVWNDMDGFLQINYLESDITKLDQEVRPGSVRLFFDDYPTDRNWTNNLTNITWAVQPYGPMLGYPARIRGARVDKTQCSRDYLLLMSRKKRAIHRVMLWQRMEKIPGLLSRGHAVFNPNRTVKALGDQVPFNMLTACHPAMDLYRDSWFEIVPETFYKDGYSLSEKTVKPFATRTPFLVATTCGHLEFVRNQFGFRTFGHLIDESYDHEHRIQDRLDRMLEQVQDIIKNGSESFYRACADVLDHNQAQVLEILGRYRYTHDLFLCEQLEAVE
jgi:hypothetical protein